MDNQLNLSHYLLFIYRQFYFLISFLFSLKKNTKLSLTLNKFDLILTFFFQLKKNINPKALFLSLDQIKRKLKSNNE